MAAYDKAAQRSRQQNAALADALERYPNAPSAPEQSPFGLGAEGRALAKGGTFGAMAGGALGGPVGALAGAAIGAGINRLRMGTPSDEATAALNAGWDGFGGQPPTGTAQPLPAPPAAPQAQELFPDGQPVQSYAALQAKGGNNNLTATLKKPMPVPQMKPQAPAGGKKPDALDDAIRQGWKAVFGT